MSRTAFWKNRKVFVTGHTGFKGSWLCEVLLQLGAQPFGFSVDTDATKKHYALLDLGKRMPETIADLADHTRLRESLARSEAEIVFHLAAQPLVRESYAHPFATFQTNVLGTAALLEAVRARKGVRAVVAVTSDKCYENPGVPKALRESDPLGGHDPYSASKGAAELVALSYGRSFLAAEGVALATARAGNVIGGGDWSRDRLLTDAFAAIFAGEPLTIRNPQATRPWQHVLEPLAGYLSLAQKLSAGEIATNEGWNFGPAAESVWSVEKVLDELRAHLPPPRKLEWRTGAGAEPHEARFLSLDSGKAAALLRWRPKLTLPTGIAKTVEWYLAFADSPRAARECTQRQIQEYFGEAHHE